MADKKPIKATYSGTDTNGLAEFVAADTIGVADGGTGLTTVATSNLLTGNGADPLSAEANLTFDGTNLTMGTGNLIVGTSGKGIDFSATSDAGGASSEVLDDYEEGTWTAVWKIGTTAQTINDSSTWYTKIGREVTVNFVGNMANTASGTGILTIEGLPYTSNSNLYVASTPWSNKIAYADAISVLIYANVSKVNVESLTNSRTGAPVNIDEADLNQYSQLRFTITYSV